MMSESAIYPYPAHWKLTTLGELCKESGGGIQTGPFGSQLHASDYVDVGIPSIMPKNISIEGVSTEDIARITEEDAQRLSKYLVKEGDIVYSRRGDVEKCSLITGKESGWLCGTGCLKVSFGQKSMIPPEYIHAYLAHPAVREWISRHAVGATMPNLNTSILSAVPILIPSEDEISVILNVWKNTTGKIVLNRQTNQTLEHIAQAIFKSWFVDFDPTRAKITANQTCQDPERAAMAAISGKTLAELDQLSTEQLEQLRTTAGLFPDALVDSELGEVPEGWEVKPLGNYLEIKRGGSPRPIKEYIVKKGLPWTKIADATAEPSPFLFRTKECIREEGLKKTVLLKKGSLILSNSATPGLPKFLELDACIHDGWLHFPKKKLFTDIYLYQLFLEIRQALVAQGNGSVFTNLKTDILRNQVVVAPSRPLIESFDDTVSLIFIKLKENCKEINTLSDLRDTLLPKLLSGELTPNQTAEGLTP